ITIGIIIILAGFLYFFMAVPLLAMQKQASVLSIEAKGIYEGLQAQDINKAVEKIASTKTEFEKLNTSYKKMVWLKIIPFGNNYYRDGESLFNGARYLLGAGDLVVESLKPYSDLLGLNGVEKETKNNATMTTEERLTTVLDTLDKIQPNLDKIGEKLDLAQGEIDKIQPSRYPKTLFGKKIRENVVSLISTIDGIAKTVKEVKPIIGYLKPILGVPDKKDYLLLFQNDAELRPTGGFLTGYAILSIQNGKFSTSNSHDIYSLDDRFGNRLKAPEAILNYHKNVFNWHLRDMNLSPDFKSSMDIFIENYEKVEGSGTVDGIIAVDTKVLVDLLKVIGPIGVSGFGNFSAENDKRCNCPQVFYELELYSDKPIAGTKEERKGIIGPLMHSILLNAMGSPRKQWPLFMNTIFTDIAEKHMLFYFFDENIQKTMEALNAGGRIKEYDGDYLHVNDCNFAGAKSNMFIKESFTQDIEVANDGTVTKTLTIDYKNPAPASNCNLEAGELCLNGLYRDWVRVYVPKGSELIEIKGSEVAAKTYEDLGKTVFEAFYGDQSPLRPEGKAQLTFKYRLPFKVDKNQPYKILIQKQPGTYGYENIINLGNKTETFDLTTDREFKL
ncbi:MAG: DUF4012 domain-containing protein, partial [Candidatus Shapirobacteria bacterium]|nr:DUF4012 domain-containing protein [Candidatus Shapirobacteria bacterium]